MLLCTLLMVLLLVYVCVCVCVCVCIPGFILLTLGVRRPATPGCNARSIR